MEGQQFSKSFREFVATCLQRDPRDVGQIPFQSFSLLRSTCAQRPTARELLKHKFIRMAKKTNYLTELIDRHERWKAEGGERIEEEELHPDIVDMYVNAKMLRN